MKIAIAASGDTMEAFISETFARCEFFVLYDSARHETTFLPNPFQDQLENAGEEAALYLIEKGAQRLVAGEFGSKMQKVTNHHNVPLIIPGDENLSILELLKIFNAKNNLKNNENSNSYK